MTLRRLLRRARRAWRWLRVGPVPSTPPRPYSRPTCVNYTPETSPHPKKHAAFWVATDSADEALSVVAGGDV
jgi:hypothetical protein